MKLPFARECLGSRQCNDGFSSRKPGRLPTTFCVKETRRKIKKKVLDSLYLIALKSLGFLQGLKKKYYFMLYIVNSTVGDSVLLLLILFADRHEMFD